MLMIPVQPPQSGIDVETIPPLVHSSGIVAEEDPRVAPAKAHETDATTRSPSSYLWRVPVLFHGTRFMLVAWLGTVVNTAALYLFKGVLDIPIIPAGLLATETALIHNFIWLRYWAWGDRNANGKRPGFLKQLLYYNLITGIADFLVNIPLLWLLYKVAGVPYLLANMAGMLIGPFIKFRLNDKLVFKEKI